MNGKESADTIRRTKKKKRCRAKKLQLLNEDGRKLTVLLREYRPGDEEGMIACIRDEYLDTYFKKNFYSPDYLRKEAESGQITFLVAQTRAGEIAGMLLLKEFAPKEQMCEVASQIFRKKYRGYGLAMPFFTYGMDILLRRNYSAAYCLPVLFHDTTQRLLFRLGFRATGFIWNVFDMEHISHSYQNGRNTKHSQGIQIRAVNKRDAGTLYMPKKYQAYCRSVYESLGVTYHMAEERADEKNNLPAVTELSYQQDDRQSSLEIRIYRIGADLTERLYALHQAFPLQGKQTANIFLNSNDPNAVGAYDSITDMGYFFSGLKPLCSEKEYMILHHAGEVKIYLEDYVISEEFLALSKQLPLGGEKSNEKKAYDSP